MAMPGEVSKKLREMLGDEAGGSMADWLDNLDSRNEELRQETRADIAEVRQEMHALREEMRAGFLEMRAGFLEMRLGFANVDVKIAGLRAEMLEKLAALDTKTSDRMTKLVMWIVGVWIASLAATVGLFNLLRMTR